ncbi:hypothetical protein FHX37_1813 [Haloactinospora alba]|uniref:Uncharacterized protein n=1 Tax=Haloactinospora alba TaxID=405555 RepID=A0A543NJA1_9ACTN|nr:hypothetical protein [Haloactinospora alba]TQN31892.1 hypothetical protein FHX37_1813 [Haloactinospora alba]
MLVSYRQPLGSRQPIRVGRTLYCRLWLAHHTFRIRSEARLSWKVISTTVNATTTRVRTAANLAESRIERARPQPMTDKKLFWVLATFAAGALAVALLLGIALSEWMMTRSQDLLPAAGGAVLLGSAILALIYLVFASKKSRRSVGH